MSLLIEPRQYVHPSSTMAPGPPRSRPGRCEDGRMWALIFRVTRWLGPYQVLWATLGIGAVTMVALTAASVEIYEAVTEADGVAGLDRPVLDLALALRSPGT